MVSLFRRYVKRNGDRPGSRANNPLSPQKHNGGDDHEPDVEQHPDQERGVHPIGWRVRVAGVRVAGVIVIVVVAVAAVTMRSVVVGCVVLTHDPPP